MKMVNQDLMEENRKYHYNCSDTINSYALVANTAQTVTVPAGATVAFFSSEVPFYAQFNHGAAAVIPVANVTNGTAPSYNPDSRKIEGISTFSVISPSTGNLFIEYFNN